MFHTPPGIIVAWLVVGSITTNRLQAQQITQIVKGTDIDKASEKPLVGVSVQVTGMPGGVITDSTGCIQTGKCTGRPSMHLFYFYWLYIRFYT